MLYPAELSSGDVPESNRCSRRCRRCLTPRPSSSGTPVPTFRHTPRQRRTHRTGHKPVPLRRVRRCSALPAVANRQSVRAHGAHFVVPSERRSRRSITTQRTCAGCSRAPASGRAQARYPDAPGRKPGVSLLDGTKPARCMRILRERQKQNAPGTCDPRAFACLGRSGWPISQGVSRD